MMMEKNSLKLENLRLFESKVFRDAVHDYIRVEYLPIWQLINAPEMQRLRRIKQLGGTSMVFQSAEHSRFTHSLGVYEIVRQMIALEQLKDQLTDYEKLTVLCAGLLHDIGHGPFSHSFEPIFKTSHETMTIRIIKEDSHIHRVLAAVHPQLPDDVAAVIEKSAKPLLVQMISSQLDADRMDYLLRDSYFCGVTYGQFDMSRLLRTLRIIDHRIVFKASGVQAIEDYILARYHMYWQVYYHPTVRSYEHLLQSIMRRVKDLYESGYVFKTNIDYLLPILKGEATVTEYEVLDEDVMLYYFHRFINEDDTILSDLAYRFVNRRLFKFTSLKSSAELKEIEKQSAACGFDPRYYVTSDLAKNIPYHHYEIGDLIGEIDILDDDGMIVSLPERSEIVSAIIHAKAKEDAKVFFVKELKGKLKQI